MASSEEWPLLSLSLHLCVQNYNIDLSRGPWEEGDLLNKAQALAECLTQKTRIQNSGHHPPLILYINIYYSTE